MPIVTIQQSPRELEPKRRLVAGITQAFVDAYGVAPKPCRCSSTRSITSTGPRPAGSRSTRRAEAVLTREHVQRWLDDYVAAWRSYDADEIRALFAPDASYAYHP